MTIKVSTPTGSVQAVVRLPYRHLDFLVKHHVLYEFTFYLLSHLLWLDGVTVKSHTYDREVVSLTPSWVAIKWLLFEWVTVFGQV